MRMVQLLNDITALTMMLTRRKQSADRHERRLYVTDSTPTSQYLYVFGDNPCVCVHKKHSLAYIFMYIYIYIYIWSKVNIWFVNCAQAAAFIFDTRTGGCSCESVKVFETENVSTWGGLEPPIFGFMPNALTYWAIRTKHLLSHVFCDNPCVCAHIYIYILSFSSSFPIPAIKCIMVS